MKWKNSEGTVKKQLLSDFKILGDTITPWIVCFLENHALHSLTMELAPAKHNDGHQLG